MPLHVPEPPRQVVDTVQSTFQTMIKTGSVRLPELRNLPGTLALAQPQCGTHSELAKRYGSGPVKTAQSATVST